MSPKVVPPNKSEHSSSDSKLLKRKKRKKEKRKHDRKRKRNKPEKSTNETPPEATTSFDIPITLMDSSKSMTPMTKEQWEKEQSIVRRVVDETTGRSRLIKGTGEVIEEIVSRDRHKLINKQATKGDGEFFQSTLAINTNTV